MTLEVNKSVTYPIYCKEMSGKEAPDDDDDQSKQKARSILRESFLRFLNEMNGKKCSILTYEKSKLDATFAGWDVEGSEVLVRDLNTPAGHIMTSALLRTPDILSIQFHENVI